LTDIPDDKPKKRRGPGRPFPKGTSGNPKGSPAGSRNRASRALDALAEGEVSDILTAMAERAKGGDVPAAALILSRAWPPRKGRPTPLNLPPVKTAADLTAATGVVIEAVADGALTAEEAHSIAAVLRFQQTALETLDHEKRIAALEAAKGR
jgi:Family of unknown function (DUF5681)